MYSGGDWTEMIPEKYTIKERLGKGGFGSVYKVKDEHINRLYALKVQKRNAFYNIEKEIEMLQSLKCSGLPALHDVFFDTRNVYIIMDLIEGRTLEEYVKEKGRLSIDETIKIAGELSNILKYLHSRPIPVIHGDLKPDNIMLAENGVSLIDFGCAYLQYSSMVSIRGTPQYAAPEWIKGEISTESDIYSFGKVLVFMLTGRMSGYVNDEKLRMLLKPFMVPRALRYIIRMCLQENPNLRFRSGMELSEKIHTIQTGHRHWGFCMLPVALFILRIFCLFFILYSLYLWKNRIAAEEVFAAGLWFLIGSNAVNAWVEKKYKNTILECECNLMVSEGL